jgi:hypothetical protein
VTQNLRAESAEGPRNGKDLPQVRRLTLDPRWVRRDRRIILSTLVFLVVVCGALGLGIAVLFRDSGRSMVIVGYAVGLPVVLLVAGMWGSDARLTRARRFSKCSDKFVGVDSDGVSGDAYPIEWYRAIPTADPRLAGFSSAAYVVRTRIFRRIAEVTEVKNFIPWSKTSLLIDRFAEELGVAFLTQDIRVENGVFHDLLFQISEEDLPSLLTIACRGGADVHVGPELLNAVGLQAARACQRHDQVANRQRKPRRFVRLGMPSSVSEAASWLARGPASLAVGVTNPHYPRTSA